MKKIIFLCGVLLCFFISEALGSQGSPIDRVLPYNGDETCDMCLSEIKSINEDLEKHVWPDN